MTAPSLLKSEKTWTSMFKPFIPTHGIILEDVERGYILEALRMKKGNKIQAAKMLGISRSALLYRIQKYGIRTMD